MMVTNYRRGYQLEHRSRKIFEDNDWTVVRSPASKSPSDLYCIKKGDVIFAQCKKTSKFEHMYIYDLRPLLEMAKKQYATPLLVYSFERSPVYAKEIEDEKENVHKIDNHVELDKYLKVRELNNNDDMIIGD